VSPLSRVSALVLLAGVMVVSSALAAPAGAPFTVSSTLDGAKVLPLRLRWIARPHIATSKIAEVDFLVDGKLRWVEHKAPYEYGGDHNGTNLGFLTTTFLTPGKHTFTTQVKDTSGNRASDNVSARVLPAPTPPAALAGTWKRTMTTQDQKKSNPKYGADNLPPVGVWHLVFDSIGTWELDPLNTGIVVGYSVNGNTVHSYAPIIMLPQKPNGDPDVIHRFGHSVGVDGGVDCTAAGPFGSYRWSVSGSELTLTAISDSCGQRRAVWEGTWTRVG